MKMIVGEMFMLIFLEERIPIKVIVIFLGIKTILLKVIVVVY